MAIWIAAMRSRMPILCSCEKPGIDGILRPAAAAFGRVSPHIFTELDGCMGAWLDCMLASRLAC